MEKKLLERYPSLVGIMPQIDLAYRIIEETYENDGTLYVCGNGGSAADSEHIVGELMKSFKVKRPIPTDLRDALSAYGEYGEKLSDGLERGLRAISLNTHEALTSAYINDRVPELVYAQQLYGHARKGDTLLTLSTSGNSKNCLYAAVLAKSLGLKVIAMTGRGGGKLRDYSDALINVPEDETYLIQELHLPVYHYLCAKLEARFFDGK